MPAKKKYHILIVFMIILFPGIAFHYGGEASYSRISERQSFPIEFFHETRDVRELDILLREFDFGEYSLSGNTEFEKMILLKDWIFYNIGYDYSNSWPFLDSIKILRMARLGESFNCGNFAAAYLQTAVSLGWTPRYFFLRKPTGEEHSTNDIWSNQYRKWVFIDPTWNMHVLKNEIPCSVLEMREEWIKNNGRDLTYVFGAGMTEKRYSFADFPIQRSDSKLWISMPVDDKWLGYTFEIAMLGRNNLFSIESADSSEFWDHIYIIKDRLNGHDWTWSFRNKKIVMNSARLFYELNRVDMQAWRKTVYDSAKKIRKSVAVVNLTASGANTFCPNFNVFQVKINNEAWQTKPDHFQVPLNGGMNEIYARIQNKFDVTGPATVVKIFNQEN